MIKSDHLMRWLRGDVFISACDPKNETALEQLDQRMAEYYKQNTYPQWVHEVNDQWTAETHQMQLQMCELLPKTGRVLEIGSGKGAGGKELRKRAQTIEYFGVDISFTSKLDSHFVCGRADLLPFVGCSFEAVVSMFVIEHLTHPHLFLDEAWRVLKPGGYFIILAPDFKQTAMISQNLGLSFGTGRTKLKARKWLDAGLTLFDSRVRSAFLRKKYNQEIHAGRCVFPILLNPRCFDLKEQNIFEPDCDAIYWVCPEEVLTHLSAKKDFLKGEIFFRNSHQFGLYAMKKV